MSSIQPTATNRTMRSIALPLAALCVVLMLLLGGVAFAIIHEYAATSCTNTALAARNGPTIEFARNLYIETQVKHPTPEQRKQLQRRTAAVIKQWYFGLRDHPLGKC